LLGVGYAAGRAPKKYEGAQDAWGPGALKFTRSAQT